ncbi:hypothetical protein OFM15_30235, partial [Escherichia coli]|nr:hypothetical protein [Escherichia coli]
DAYFVVRQPKTATDEELVAIGHELLDGLRLIAETATARGRRALGDYFVRVTHVAVVPAAECDRGNDDHTLVREAVGDFLSALAARENP